MNLLLCSLVVIDATRINNPRVVQSASFGSQTQLAGDLRLGVCLKRPKTMARIISLWAAE